MTEYTISSGNIFEDLGFANAEEKLAKVKLASVIYDLITEQELVLPISHALLSPRQSLTEIKTVYSHPQALAQCQKWLENNLPTVPIIPTNSTTEAIQILDREANSAAIASPRAAKLYNVPILIQPINDYPDNCTRFWVMALTSHRQGERISNAIDNWPIL